MGNDKLKIKGFIIEKLHGYIDYDIKFNDDVTFLYGENGCGKTTVLNIITSIITGKIYELSKYQFGFISLSYSSQRSNPLEFIYIKKDENGTIKLTYNRKEHIIEMQHTRIIPDTNEIERFYFNEYRVLTEIKNEFNYIYLPLNRHGNVNIESELDFNFRRKMSRTKAGEYYSSDITLNDVSFLVRNSYIKINYTLNKINEGFNEELLKSFLDVENMTNAKDLFDFATKLNPSEVETLKENYTKVLKLIKKWDSETEEKINDFFNSLLDDIKNPQNHNGLPLTTLFKLSELTKIKSVIKKAEKIDQSKEKTSLPITKFVDTVNSFINTKSNRKKVFVDENGEIYLKTPHKNRIDLHQLSSGEKQIVTFFAYLLFGLQDTNQSMFIVDEPELSLHLQWQLKFVDTLLELNPDIQLIFATHSPEIIGRHRDKAFKLIPNY